MCASKSEGGSESERGRPVGVQITFTCGRFRPTDRGRAGPAMRMDTLAVAAAAASHMPCHASLRVGLTMTILCDFLISCAPVSCQKLNEKVVSPSYELNFFCEGRQQVAIFKFA